MHFIDTHIHLQDDNSSNATEIIRQAVEAGCQKMICVSSREADWQKVGTLATQFRETVIPAFACHPWYVEEVGGGWQNRLSEQLEKYPSALIGECGLDGLKPNIEKQKQIFAEHLRLAKEYHRPLIIHAVKAVMLMEEFWQELPEKFVFHGYNGKAEFLKKIIQRGSYIGIGAGFLRHPQAREMLSLIPKQKILFESDAPFQTVGAWVIKEQIKQAADLLGVSAEQLSVQSCQNSEEFIK